MRSPWVGSLALLAPAHGFMAQSSVVRGGTSMLQAFARPSTGGIRSVSSRGWRDETLRLQRVAPRVLPNASGVRMAGGGGGGGQAKKEKVKKPESYYKQTVILPQTSFEQVRVGLVGIVVVGCEL